MLEDYPEVDLVMGTDCLSSLLDDGEDYFEDVRWTLSEEWNSGAPLPRPATSRPPPAPALRVDAPAAEHSLCVSCGPAFRLMGLPHTRGPRWHRLVRFSLCDVGTGSSVSHFVMLAPARPFLTL